MQLLRRRFVKVGLFFACLLFLFAGSEVNAPKALATGEYYQYIAADDTIRVTGGVLKIPAGLQRTGADSFQGGITVPGPIARIPTGNDPASDPRMQGDCPYSLGVTGIQGDLKLPGLNGGHAASAGFPFTIPKQAPGPGDCRVGNGAGLAEMMDLIDQNVTVRAAADTRGDAGGNACPGSNAPAGTDCATIAAGCPGSTKPAPPTPPDQTTCKFQAVAATDTTEEPDICPVEKGTALRWIACPIVAGGEAITNRLDSIINYFLTINTKEIFGNTNSYGSASTADTSSPGDPGKDNGFYKAWSTFRNFGIGLVVIAGLIMVISEALGLQLLDAYTVRKTLPRLFVAVIGISLSWSLMYFLITFFNNIGTGMADIIYSSFGGIQDQVKLNAGAIFVQYFAIGGGLLALGVLGILSFLGTLILALLAGIAVLILREGIVLMSVIIAPLAIASYVLPNTAKFSKFWWDTFIKALMAFPIITGFIAICKVMAIISGNIGN